MTATIQEKKRWQRKKRPVSFFLKRSKAAWKLQFSMCILPGSAWNQSARISIYGQTSLARTGRDHLSWAGLIRLIINMTLTHLKSPCFCFINSGELHALTSDSEQYQEQAVVFSPDLLTFAAPDPAQEQFLLPLSEHKLSFPSFSWIWSPGLFGSTAGIFPDPLNLFPRKPEPSGAVYNRKFRFTTADQGSTFEYSRNSCRVWSAYPERSGTQPSRRASQDRDQLYPPKLPASAESWLHLPEWMSSTSAVFSKKPSAKHPFPISMTFASGMRQRCCARPNCPSRRSVWKAGSIISDILWKNSKKRPSLHRCSSEGKVWRKLFPITNTLYNYFYN